MIKDGNILKEYLHFYVDGSLKLNFTSVYKTLAGHKKEEL